MLNAVDFITSKNDADYSLKIYYTPNRKKIQYLYKKINGQSTAR